MRVPLFQLRLAQHLGVEDPLVVEARVWQSWTPFVAEEHEGVALVWPLWWVGGRVEAGSAGEPHAALVKVSE